MGLCRGDVIAVSRPFAYVILTRSRGERCDTCLIRKDGLRRCAHCSLAYYCDKACQKNSWADHKLECASLVKVQPRVPPDYVLLLARIIRKQKREGDNEEKIGDISRRFSDLMSHKTEIKVDDQRKDIFDVSYYVLSQYLNDDELPDRETVFETLGKIFINAITILDEQESIASGLYIGPSVFNHSCLPNATVVFNGPQMVVRSLVDSSSLEISEVYINYIDLFGTTESRRKKLREQFYFFCQCPACLDTARDGLMHSMKCANSSCLHPVVPGKDVICAACSTSIDSQRVKRAESLMKTLEQTLETTVPNETNIKKARKLLDNILKDAQNFLHPLNIFLIKGLDEGFDICIRMKDFDSALKYGLLTLPGFREYSSEAQVALPFQLAKIGKIQLLLDHFEDAKANLLEANEYLRFHYGASHPTYQRFKDTLVDLKTALG